MSDDLKVIAESIHREAQEKYKSENLLNDLEGYSPEVFGEIVEFFKVQNEAHPYLEAFEIYLVIEEALPSKNPSKKDIQKVIGELLNIAETA